MNKPITHVREIAFIDPAVVDIPVLVAGLRPEVVPVLLGGELPAAEVIARTVRDYEALDAIHVVAHGRPGELSFTAGALSRASIDHHAADLAAIGDALGPDGEVLLWSCHTGEGVHGRAFVEALSRSIGAPVAAATGAVGSASLGGRWELDTPSPHNTARPPVTATGATEYSGVLASAFVANFTITGISRNKSGTYALVDFSTDTPTIVGLITIPNLNEGTTLSFALPVDVNPGDEIELRTLPGNGFFDPVPFPVSDITLTPVEGTRRHGCDWCRGSVRISVIVSGDFTRW